MNAKLSYLLTAVTGLITVTAAGGPAPSVAADLGTTTGTQWSPYLQWTVDNPTWNGNAFDVLATVEFTHHPGGETRRTEMFFVGGDAWAFRFTGTRIGLWSFITSSVDKNLHGHTGRVHIEPNPHADMHGFLKKFGGKWGWEGTENVFVPQLLMWDYVAGSNSPRVFHNKPELIDSKIEQFLVNHGFNGFHVPVIGGRWFDLEAASDRVESTMTDPDIRTFEALELLIAKTHAAGGLIHIWPWGDHQRSQTPRSLTGGIGGVTDQRLQRYIAARLGPVPGWSMGYGFDLDEWVTAGKVKAWRDSLHRHLGWSHFLGGRPVGPNHGTDHASNAMWNKGLDYSSYEHHRPTFDVYQAAVRATPGQPVMSEDRFRIRKGRYPEKDYSYELTRRGLYNSTMAGGVANIWGIDPDLSRGGVYPNKEQIKTYSVFFHDKIRFLADMTPASRLSSDADTRALFSRRVGSLVLYREAAAAIHVDLTSMYGPQPAVAVDTKRPYSEIELGRLKPEAQTIKLPTVSDWVVAVGHFPQRTKDIQRRRKVAVELSFTDIWKGPSLKGGHGAMWGDVDGDELPDLYLPLIISGTLPDLFMHNKGGGVFAEEGKPRGIADPDGGSHGAAWCDLDNDGDYDLINGTTFDDHSGIQNDVFRNDGNGNFVEMKPHAIESRQEATRAVICFDMDRDGDLDFFGVSNYQGSADPPDETNEVYRNEGSFQFTSITAGDLVTAPAGQGATDTDIDGDGDVDVLAANRTGQAGFCAETCFYPAGQAGDVLLGMRESQSNCGYLGQNNPVLHFGLGHRNCVDLVVMFLDGTTATRYRVAANQTIQIKGAPDSE